MMLMTTTEDTTAMAMTKIAISLPEEVASEVDLAAQERGESRSAFIASVLRLALRARRGEQITRRLNALFADTTIVAEQKQLTREMDAAGTDWSDERW